MQKSHVYFSVSLMALFSANALAEEIPAYENMPVEPPYVDLMKSAAPVSPQYSYSNQAQPVLVSQDYDMIPVPEQHAEKPMQVETRTLGEIGNSPLSMQALETTPPASNAPAPLNNIPLGAAPVKRMNNNVGVPVGNYGPNTGRYYVSMSGQIMMPENQHISAEGQIPAYLKYETSYGVTGAVGYYYTDNVRLEGEGSFKNNSLKSITSVGTTTSLDDSGQSMAGMGVNAYYDFNEVSNEIVPYIGAGLGYQFLTNGEKKGSGMSGQLMAGASYEIEKDLSFFGGYKFFTTQDMKIGAYKLPITDHIVEAGLRYKFQ
jgi:outer membrane protein W